jgi:hypothetical protein
MACNQIACLSDEHHDAHPVQIAELLTQAGMQVRADEVITAAVLTAVRPQPLSDARASVNSADPRTCPASTCVSSDFTGPKAPEKPDVVLLAAPGRIAAT